MTVRKYFGTDGVRGLVGQYPITPEFALRLGWAAGRVLSTKGTRKVLIGKDTRISGYMLETALESGLIAAGLDVGLMGPMPTPGVAYLTQTFRAEAGIVISASHNPYHDNGIKFFSSDGTKLADEVELAIEAELDKEMTCVDSANLGKAYRIADAAGRYIEFCKRQLPYDLSLSGLKIVVDCANGATYHIAPNVFQELGADVISIACEPDGLNINRECGATHLDALQNAVIKYEADVGIALDGDGDRLMMVDRNGQAVDGDQLLYILACHNAAQPGFAGGVVGTQMSNMGLEVALKQRGIDFLRSKVGDRYVLELLRQQGWHIGGESSGHLINLLHTTTGDGVISAVQILEIMVRHQQGLETLLSDMNMFPQTMINVRVSQNKNELLENEALQSLVKQVEDKLAGAGRVLLRPSGTEPVIRVMVEAEDKMKTTHFAQEIADFVEKLAG
ncbi:phosphoglucosamine mutase [Algicola sagamiensis]|uniref:phosphoglucosamine mutase n=1 Tax=Algicola sagamiensis TaxID=163869 RepID=UPI00035E05CB|nr:phosphoglucosamine mutase [Algicola sagamiensis]